MNASFFKRLAAYLIDTIFITLVVSLITSGITSKEYDDAYERYLELNDMYTNSEITMGEYMDDISVVMYKMNKSSALVTGISITLSVAYFIVFQYLNKGQTLGKKLLRIKVTEKGNNPSLKSIIIRCLLVDSILTSLFGLVLLYILKESNYYLVYSGIEVIEMIFVFVSALFILYRKDKLGLHDIISHTEVIEEKR